MSENLNPFLPPIGSTSNLDQLVYAGEQKSSVDQSLSGALSLLSRR